MEGLLKNTDKLARYRVTVTGTVQGVGFRPFVYGLAKTYDLAGSVLNAGGGLIIDIEGREANLRRFIDELREHPPALSRIAGSAVDELPAKGYDTFQILESVPAGRKNASSLPMSLFVIPAEMTCIARQIAIINTLLQTAPTAGRVLP